MFRIADGREQFYQWDLDRQLIVEDKSIVEVHFCNRTDDCSIVTEVVDGLANVPNILLQSSFDIRVFGYDGKATLHDKKFKVNARTRPADYVYTETEVLSIQKLEEELRNDIEERLDKIEEGVTVDLTGYATEEYVDEAIAAIEIPEGSDVDLTNYVTTDTEQEITGTKTFTQSVKVTSPTASAILTGRGLALSSSSNNAVVQLNRQPYDYGINIQLAGTGYTTSEDERLYIHCGSEYNHATLGTASTPWYEMHLKTLSDGKTSKSVTDVLAAPTMSEVSQAIQDALNAIGVAEGGAY